MEYDPHCSFILSLPNNHCVISPVVQWPHTYSPMQSSHLITRDFLFIWPKPSGTCQCNNDLTQYRTCEDRRFEPKEYTDSVRFCASPQTWCEMYCLNGFLGRTGEIQTEEGFPEFLPIIWTTTGFMWNRGERGIMDSSTVCSVGSKPKHKSCVYTDAASTAYKKIGHSVQ